MIIIFVMQFISAVAFILFKKSLLYGPPFLVVGLRLFLGGVALMLGYLVVRKKGDLILLKKAWLYVVAAGVVNSYVTNAYGIWSMQYLSAGFASFMYNLSPFVSALGGLSFFA